MQLNKQLHLKGNLHFNIELNRRVSMTPVAEQPWAKSHWAIRQDQHLIHLLNASLCQNTQSSESVTFLTSWCQKSLSPLSNATSAVLHFTPKQHIGPNLVSPLNASLRSLLSVAFNLQACITQASNLSNGLLFFLFEKQGVETFLNSALSFNLKSVKTFFISLHKD